MTVQGVDRRMSVERQKLIKNIGVVGSRFCNVLGRKRPRHVPMFGVPHPLFQFLLSVFFQINPGQLIPARDNEVSTSPAGMYSM